MRYAWFALALIAVVGFGLFAWYGTLHPCEMLKIVILRVEGIAAGPRANSEDGVGAMMKQLFGDAIARPVVDAWVANKTPGECAESLFRYNWEGLLYTKEL